jgi:hypothetical protein
MTLATGRYDLPNLQRLPHFVCQRGEIRRRVFAAQSQVIKTFLFLIDRGENKLERLFLTNLFGSV